MTCYTPEPAEEASVVTPGSPPDVQSPTRETPNSNYQMNFGASNLLSTHIVNRVLTEAQTQPKSTPFRTSSSTTIPLPIQWTFIPTHHIILTLTLTPIPILISISISISISTTPTQPQPQALNVDPTPTSPTHSQPPTQSQVSPQSHTQSTPSSLQDQSISILTMCTPITAM